MMKLKYIWNPFIKFTETQLLIIGVLTAIAGTITAQQLGVVYDGVIDAHLSKNTVWEYSIVFNLIDILCIALLLYGLGKIIYAKTRFIDILNVALIYRIPIYISSFFISLPVMNKTTESLVKNPDLTQTKINNIDILILFAISLVLIALIIYSIVILVNGFKVAANVKNEKHYLFFILALIAAELLSKALIQFYI